MINGKIILFMKIVLRKCVIQQDFIHSFLCMVTEKSFSQWFDLSFSLNFSVA